MRSSSVAHQFLSKPCEPIILQQTIERACNLQNLIQDQSIKQLVGKIDKLPMVPKIYNELTRVLANPNTQAKDIARLLERDMSMSAKLLQLANSSFFRVGKPITTMELAVSHMGFNMVKNLVLSVEVFNNKHQMPKIPGLSFEQIQQQALLTAHIASRMLKDKKMAQDAFMAGILHDIGKIVLAITLPDRLSEAVHLAKTEECPLYQAEQKLFKVTHAEVGGYLLGIWGLPYTVIEAVANHHTPERVDSKSFDILSAVYCANVLAGGHLGNDAAEISNNHLEAYLTKFKMLNQLESWQKLVQEQATQMISL